MKNIAIILAGGSGSRFGEKTPKQFLKVAGKSVIEHTVDAFEKNPLIDEIAIVVGRLFAANIEEMLISNRWVKVKKILAGGKERYESSIAAINAYEGKSECNMIFHDAVRPLVSGRIIDDVVKALEKYKAVDVAIPATDTIIKVDGKCDFIEEIPNRNFLKRGQTPQGFRLSTIREAYKKALKDKNLVSTDDCGIVVKYLPKEKIFIVKGEESNIKLTYKEDIYLLDKLFQLKSYPLSGKSNLKLLKGKIIVVFGGSSGIGEKVVEIVERHGAKAYSFSRSSTQTDISDRKSVKKALEKVHKLEKRIDYIVNSAAILFKEPFINMSEEDIDCIININYKGMINVAIESYNYLKQSKGHLLFYTSSSYTRGRAFYSMYSSTKAATVNFVQALAQEWEKSEIRVNVINPQRTKTPMRIKNFGNEPDKTLLSAEKVAEVSIKTLLSNFTGQIIDVKKDVSDTGLH